jgi:modulator of FtsH protease HflK
MTMSRSTSALGNFSARLTAVAAAAAALMTSAFTTLRWRLGDRSTAVLNSGGRGDGPPDLEEVWRNFNGRLSSLFGGGKPSGEGNSSGNNFQPDMKNAGVGVGLVVAVIVAIWGGSGFFKVDAGEQSVITSFGKYSKTVEAGFNWRFPYPFQSNETVLVTELRTVEVGRATTVAATGLRESLMLTQDENIVDIRFSVQFKLKNARDYLFENRDPDQAVTQAAESAVREIVGRTTMDSVLYEKRDAVAIDLAKSIQAQLDRLKTGIQVINVNVGHVQPPEQVQAAFEDAVRAGLDRERLKNEGEAYARDVVPKAQIPAAQLREQAKAYAARVVSEAEGDAQRFSRVLAEYQKAPGVTRDRLYIDTMRQVYANVTKVMVDSRSNSNMLYLPLDKLMQQATSSNAPAPAATTAPVVGAEAASPSSPAAPAAQTPAEVRPREVTRSRERDAR